MSEALFTLRKDDKRAKFSFTWPDGSVPWDGSGELKLVDGARSALADIKRIADELEAAEREISEGPFPPISPPFLGKIDAVSIIASWAGWDWEWDGDEPPAVMAERYELEDGAVS